jgi:hypothetical protein
MRVFGNYDKAKESLDAKKKYWINSRCPFNGNLCGSSCALFHLSKDENGEPHFVILGCKGKELRIYIDETIE